MADEIYQKKLESLQKYIPFLVNMMAELKAKGNRQAQLAKIQSLHDMISDSKKKLKIETLSRCEEVLTNIYFKVNPQLRAPKSPSSKPDNSKNLPGIESPRSTPESPSPPRDVIPTKPINIPTEKVTNETKGTSSRNSPRTSNIYSNALINSPSKARAPPPDMSKPPISLDDLKTLEDDVQQKIADAAFSNKSVDELQEVRKQLQLQLRVDEVTSAMSPEKPKEYVNPSAPLTPMASVKESKSSKRSHKTHKTKGNSNAIKDSSSRKSSKNSVKDVDLFGNVLSSIDSKLLEDKKLKKGDRRSSVSFCKEDSVSLSSDSQTIDTKKSKETKHKKDGDSGKHRRSSIDQMKNVDKVAEKSKAATKPINDTPKSEPKDQSTDKEYSKSIEIKEEDSNNDEVHIVEMPDCLKVEEEETNIQDSANSDTGVNSDTSVINSDTSVVKSERGINSDPRVSHSDPRISKSDPRVSHSDPRFSNSDPRISPSDPRITHSDPRVSKSDPRVGNSDARVSNSDPRISSSDPRLNLKDQNISIGNSSKFLSMASDAVSNSGPIYKRLADKYNPKPKQKPNESLVPDVDKAVSDNIEKLMRVSPAKPLTSPLEQFSQESKPVQLPDILQKIFSKPLLGDIIPKRLTEPILPFSNSVQTRPQNVNLTLTKPGAIIPPEPPILSPPHKPIHFQPPPRFLSPPRSDLGLSPDQMGRSPLLQPPTPVPAPQPMPMSGLGPLPSLIPGHGILPAPPMPPNLPLGFMERGMNMGFGTPRVDFDMPGTPRVDFDMPGTPRIDFDMPGTPRIDFDMPGTPRVDFDMPGTPHVDFDMPRTPMPDFDSPRVEFEPPHFMRNDQYNVNRCFMSPMPEQQMPRNVNYLNQGHFNQQSEVNNFNPYESGQGKMPFYGANHMNHQSNMEMPQYMADQSFYQDRFRWNRDRRPGDPRNYREYKEMRERQEREARANQEKVMEIKDPRLAPRESRESHGENFREPRWSKDSSIEPVIRSKSETGIRDPRLSKELEKGVEHSKDLTDRGRSLDRNNKDPRRGRLREIFSDSWNRGRENKFESNKFDKMYSRTSRARSRSRSRDRDDRVADDNDESFVSPLDSLYNAGEKGKTGKGYGFQKFKIPRKPKEADFKKKDAKREEATGGSVNHRRRIIESSDSEDSGTNDVSEPTTLNDSDSEEEQSDKAGKSKINSSEKGEVALIEESKKNVDKPDVDVSRIKVVIKSTDNDAADIWDATSKAAEPDDFISEYDREFASSSDKSKTKKPAKQLSTISKTSKKSLKSKDEGIQREEPSSSEDVTQKTSKPGKADSSNKFDDVSVEADSLADNDFKKPSEPSEADSSKGIDGTITAQERTTRSDEPSEQNILAHFFENLLKSKNKNDKKSALFSLIETFSDSFEDKEIQKIRKIIKVNEDVIDASDEENDESTSAGQNQPSTLETVKESSNIEEQAVVGSTTEEEHGLQVTSITEQAETSETQVNEVTKSSDISEEQLMSEAKPSHGLSLEPVMVSVGERIKNRKRNPAPAKQRKKFKSELDLLHEDIQDMFIRDGVLTATGKRMCRILKDDPNVLSTNDQTMPVATADQPKKLRKKPGPKPKIKANNQEVIQNSLKDMRVVIKKMPDEVVSTGSSRRQLRSQTRHSSYAETDDDIQEANFGELPFANSIDAGSDKSDLERESADESEEDNKTSEITGDIPKVKVKRRKVPKWASGIIRKKKKKPQQNTSKDNSPERTELPISEKADDSADVSELEVDKLIEPDISYYYDYASKRKLDCKLCKYSGHLLTGHYLKEHPQCEVLCSRFSPQVATEAIKDFASFGETFVNIVASKISSKYHYCCRMCGYKSFVSPIFFYEHITTHTGEYRHHCGICEYSSVTSKTMAVHFSAVHPDQEKKVIKTGYTSAVIFAYMCGECNFVQLNEKTVEDHANIFHLGEKTTIYKINMSTTLDPQLLARCDSSSEVKNDLPSGSNDELVTDVTPIGTGDNAQLKTAPPKEVTKRKKTGPKSKAKAQQNTQNTLEIEEKDITPVLRKRPGPKSKTLQIVDQKELISTENTETNPLSTPAQVRKKPGPKSRTQKSKSAISKETLANDQPTATPVTEDGVVRDAPARKRRRSLEKLIPEDSGDDLDAIITLSSRSSRAAKEKATAKLKTLMESNEGTALKKRTDSETAKQDQTVDTERPPMENSVTEDHNLAEQEYVDIEAVSEDIAKKEKYQVEEMHPPVVSVKPSQGDKDLNVFTCKGDILQEESRKIEEDRLRTMDELNKSIGSRTLKLDFTHKLSNRLNEEQRANENTAIKVKQEPKENNVTCDELNIDIPVFSQLEHKASDLPTIPPSITKGSKSPIISKKPVLEESTVKPSNINFRQNKPNSLFCNMIEKLQAAVEQENVTNNMEPAVEDSSDSQPPVTPEMVFSIGDLIKATRTDKEISYSCHANNCYVSTKDKMVFQLHCKFGHKDLNLKSSLCEKCGVVVGVTPDTTLLENLYDHLVFAHSDFITKSSVLRMRRLSGDKLSIKKEHEIPKPPEHIEAQDFEAEINRHILECIPVSVASATAKALETGPAEEAVASEASLEPSEDNPFSFKIASVMSLAEANESQTLKTSKNVKPKTGAKAPQLPPLKLVPPLTLISNAPKQQASAQQSLIVKEAKLTTAELGRPKKAPKALQKFIECPGDLYKCPHFYCMFSTNVRTLLISHLKAHKCDSSTMVPCVYCDMKTPWKHVPMHIDIRHASSKYSCSYCLYRAAFKEYVCLHQEQSHPDLEYVIVALPAHKAAKKFSVADPKTDYKILCEPFRCICKKKDGGQLEAHDYLFDTEFFQHLNIAHANELITCGYPRCSSKISASLMIDHWASIHGVNAYQCGYCKTNNKDVVQMYTHFSQFHSNLAPDILVRKNIPLSQDRELGYSDEAFRQIYHIKKLPSTILATIGKRAQRSIKLVHLNASSGTPEDSSISNHVEDPNTGISPGASLLINTNLNNVPTTQSLSPQLLFSKPNLKLIVASTSGSSEKVYLLPASIVSPSKGKSVTSTASISKATVQTSTASRAILAQTIPQEPFTLGDITIYPTDGSEVIQPTTKNDQESLAAINTSSSQSTVTMLSNSLLKTTLPVSSAVFENPVATQAAEMLTSSKPIVVAKIKSASKGNNDSFPDNEHVMENVSNKAFQDELASEHGSIGLSEDDMLQSAIQSILQHEDDSNSSNTQPESNISDNITSAPASTNGSHSGTPGPLPGMILHPPPLVLINSPTTQATSDKLSAHPQGEVVSEVAPVEHVNVSGNLLDGPFESGEVDPLNLESNMEFNPEAPFILDSSELDPLSDDTLTTALASNTDLSSADPLSVHESIAIQDPLNVNTDIIAEVGVQPDTESSLEPQKITSMRRSGSLMSNSDEESDSSTSEKKRCGLMGYQLFRCAVCNLSFSNVKMFKSHVSSSLTCRKTGARGFVCVHCDKGLKTCQRLSEHILTHGVPRFSCSLCSEKFTTVGIAKLHMKNRHSINQISFVPMKSDRNNMETDAFVIKPCQPNAPSGKDKESTSDSTKPTVEEYSFTPDQLESIPIRQIFNTNVKCGLCNYQTKVRVNIIRHLQMHRDEKAVPDSAPVNPVPCLEKNERMFDKMINLAASSASTPGRMGGPVKADKEKEDEKYPEFIPSHRRFVCCAQGCSYLCPEEGNLKHHLMALHSDDSNFTCPHCKVNIEPSEIENVIKHFKFHGLHLYKCQNCNFFHHFKHKIEKHITDEHPDMGIKVVTVRYMEAEPQDFVSQEESVAPPQTPLLTKSKRWSCCMCKARYYTREDIISHITKKHNIDAQYKCTLCAFKNDEEESFKEHFKDNHPNHELDIVFMYRKIEEEVIKEDVGTPFDTTPLWQRDKPRVRHIRGILFDESSPQPTKSSPKKPKGFVGVSPKVVVATASKTTLSVSATATPQVTPSASRSASPTMGAVSKNLFDCIDAVARGTAETLQNRPGTSGFSYDKKNAVATSAPIKKVSPLFTIEPRKEDEPGEVPSTGADDNDLVKSKSESGNDDVVVVAPAPNIIVIDSDETDTEEKPSDLQPNPKDDEIPKTKDKDSKIKPMAKNRGVKRQGTTDLLDKAVKMAKIEEPDDDDYILASACSKQSLISMYGKFGSPNNKQWKCPKCNQFRSKRVGDFMYHLYKDFNAYRYRCKVCSDLSVTYNYMQDHARLHPNFTEEFIEKLAPNIKLDTWIHMVIREQSLIILKNAPLFKKRPLTGPTDIMCYFCNDKFMSMPECCEHMLYHWVMMPYQCQHCPSEFYTVYDLKHHHKVEHPDAKLYLDPKGATLSRAIQCIENPKKKAPKPLEMPPKKKPRLNDSPAVTKEDVTSGLVINPNKRKKKAKLACSPKSGTSEIISVDDDEDDLVIVSKTDDRVPNDDDVFVCDACVFIADTEVLVIKHLLEEHGIKTDKYHILSKTKSNMENVQKLGCNVCDQIFSELQLRRHFVEEHLQSHTYAPYKFKCNLCTGRFLTLGRMKIHFGKAHSGSQLSYQSVVPISNERKTKWKQYSCTLCAFRTFSSSTVSMTTHLKGHLRPVLCNLCNKRFKYESEVLTHSFKKHPQSSPDYVTLNDVIKEYTETMKIIVKNSVLVSNTDTAGAQVNDTLSTNMAKNVAKKSTSTPFLSPKDHPDDDEYSYYGIPQEDLDLANIETTFELDGLEYTTTAEQMMKMFNMDTYVDISDCAVDIIPLDKS